MGDGGSDCGPFRLIVGWEEYVWRVKRMGFGVRKKVDSICFKMDIVIKECDEELASEVVKDIFRSAVHLNRHFPQPYSSIYC